MVTENSPSVDFSGCSAVLTKLGVTSRQAATTEARHLGLIAPANLGSSVGGYG